MRVRVGGKGGGVEPKEKEKEAGTESDTEREGERKKRETQCAWIYSGGERGCRERAQAKQGVVEREERGRGGE